MLRIRKINTCTSNNEWWCVFPEGDIMHPVCFLYEHEVKELLRDLKREAPLTFIEVDGET